MTKEEFRKLSNTKKVEFLNGYLGRTKSCNSENEFVWAFAVRNTDCKKVDNKFVELSEEELEELNKNEKQKPKKVKEKKETVNQFTDEEVKQLKELLLKKDQIIEFTNDYKLGALLNLGKNKFEVMNNLKVSEKENKCYRINTDLLEQLQGLKQKFGGSESDLVNYALYRFLESERNGL
jgi:hypothetical protein